MLIYAIKQEIRLNCDIDVSQINGKAIEHLDDYLFHFPLQRKLAYAYIKYSEEVVKLSQVHQLFKSIDDIEWLLHSTTHKKRMKQDDTYAKVVTKYIRNPWTWTSSMVHMQPHLFDAKYLKLGQFQSVAHKCNWSYLNTQNMHWTSLLNGVRTMEGLVKHNEWFVQRRKLEYDFFEGLLSRFTFSPQLRLTYYFNTIEVYDDVSKLCMQFEIYPTSDVVAWIMYPMNAKKRGRKVSNVLTMKMLAKYNELFSLYQLLNSIDVRKQYQKYYDKLAALKVTHKDTWDRLHASTVQLVTDLGQRAKGAHWDKTSMIYAYFVRQGSVDRCGITSDSNLRMFRMHRRTKILNDRLERTDVINYSAYNNPYRTVEKFADWLLNVGFINISHINDIHNLYDYELLATGKSQTFALQFLKLPQTVASEYFVDYEERIDMLKHEVKWLAEHNVVDIPDTRQFEDFSKTHINTHEEFKHWQECSSSYDEEREVVLKDKLRLMHDFKLTNKHLFQTNG